MLLDGVRHPRVSAEGQSTSTFGIDRVRKSRLSCFPRFGDLAGADALFEELALLPVACEQERMLEVFTRVPLFPNP